MTFCESIGSRTQLNAKHHTRATLMKNLVSHSYQPIGYKVYNETLHGTSCEPLYDTLCEISKGKTGKTRLVENN